MDIRVFGAKDAVALRDIFERDHRVKRCFLGLEEALSATLGSAFIRAHVDNGHIVVKVAVNGDRRKSQERFKVLLSRFRMICPRDIFLLFEISLDQKRG